MFIYILAIVHIGLIGWVCYDYQQKKIELDLFLVSFLLLFPIVGFWGVYFINATKRKVREEGKPNFDEIMPWLVSEEVKAIDQTGFAAQMDIHQLVPLQEALLINDVRIRRHLLMDVAFHHPERYVKLLHQARLNDDVEVVHYATTILSELTKAYDEKLYAVKQSTNLTLEETMNAQLDVLYRYVKMGLAEGIYDLQLKREFVELSHRKLMSESRGLIDFIRLGEIYVEMQAKEELLQLVQQMMKEFPLAEESWMLKLEYAILAWSSRDLDEVLEQFEERRVYFSNKNREKLTFWKNSVGIIG